MGYFSNAAIDYDDGREDHSLMPYRVYLQDRLVELRQRLIELLEKGDEDRAHVLPGELEVTLPRDLHNAEDVRAAIGITQQKFWKECGFEANFDAPAKALPNLADGYEQVALFPMMSAALRSVVRGGC